MVYDTSVQDETFVAEMLKQFQVLSYMNLWNDDSHLSVFSLASVPSQAGHSKQLPAAA